MEETQFTPALLEPVLARFGDQIVAAYLSKKSLLLSRFIWKRGRGAGQA
jgi:hypothetical protein